jgi:hypothetical protein
MGLSPTPIAHVSASPQCHPGRSDFSSPVGDHGFPQTASPIQWKLKCWLTYAPHRIGLLFGSCCKFCYPPYSGTAPCDGFLPTPPCAESPFAQNQALPAFGTMSCIMSDGVTHPSSLILAHAPDQIPPAVFDLTIPTGLCRLSPVPAGRWPFPTLSLQSLRRRLDPYPAVSFWCTCSLLPRRQRPHVRRHTFGTLKIPPIMQLQPGYFSRGCSHSLMFRLPHSLDPQVAPTAEI